MEDRLPLVPRAHSCEFQRGQLWASLRRDQFGAPVNPLRCGLSAAWWVSELHSSITSSDSRAFGSPIYSGRTRFHPMKTVIIMDDRASELLLDGLNQRVVRGAGVLRVRDRGTIEEAERPPLKIWRRIQKLVDAKVVEVARVDTNTQPREEVLEGDRHQLRRPTVPRPETKRQGAGERRSGPTSSPRPAHAQGVIACGHSEGGGPHRLHHLRRGEVVLSGLPFTPNWRRSSGGWSVTSPNLSRPKAQPASKGPLLRIRTPEPARLLSSGEEGSSDVAIGTPAEVLRWRVRRVPGTRGVLRAPRCPGRRAIEMNSE